MTDNDDTIGIAELAWQMGLRQPSLLREFVYDTLPQKDWPGKGRHWAFTPDNAEAIRQLHSNIPEKMRMEFLHRDGDEMYDLSHDLTSTGEAKLRPWEDVAAIMQELIYYHEVPVILHSRNHRGTVLRTDTL